MQRKTILIISNAYPSKEKPFAGIFVKNQINELKCRNDYFVQTFLMQRTFTGITGSIIKYLRVYVRFIPYLFRRFDLIHLHFFFPLIWAVVIYKFFRPYTPIVVTFHGSDLHQRFRGTLLKILHKYALTKVDYVHCVGKDLADELKGTLGRDANLIMPVGVDKSIFNIGQTRFLDKQYDFIFVGSFIKRKGIDLIMEAMTTLCRKEFSFCFVGSGPEEYTLRQYAASYEIIIFKNLSQSDIAILLRKSRFFLMPSRYEPFGLVVTEALYCGVPCIVSKVGGLREQVEGSKNGIFINSLDSKGVASAMEHMASMGKSDYLVMSKNAENSNINYSLKSVVDRLENIYSVLLSKTRD